MLIELIPVKIEEKDNLEKLLLSYILELNSLRRSNKKLSDYEYLHSYWGNNNRFPFFITFDDKIVGLCLVNNYTRLTPVKPTLSVAEFFVHRDFRRKGIGKAAAFELFDKFQVSWEVAVYKHNVPAIIFWKKIIHEYTKGSFREDILDNETWQGIVHTFEK